MVTSACYNTIQLVQRVPRGSPPLGKALHRGDKRMCGRTPRRHVSAPRWLAALPRGHARTRVGGPAGQVVARRWLPAAGADRILSVRPAQEQTRPGTGGGRWWAT
jgi:hypothetical protein